MDNFGCEHENDLTRSIVMHTPGLEIDHAGQHPRAALFQEVVDSAKARSQHEKLINLFRSQGIKVHVVRDVLLSGTMDKDGEVMSGKDYDDLLDFASKYLTYDTTALEQEFQTLEERANQLDGIIRSTVLSKLKVIEPQISSDYQENYRQTVLKSSSPEDLVNIIINRPTIILHLRHWFTDDDFFVELRQDVLTRPMNNLYYARDQQITTRKGIVMLNSVVRKGEKDVMEFVFRKLKLPVLGHLKEGYAEGGDYFPFGNTTLIGQGFRTTQSAIYYMMKKDWFGTDEVVVVKGEKSMQRMHLDTVFNILDVDKVLALEDILYNPEMMRTVDIYKKSHGTGPTGAYHKVASDKTLLEFLNERNIKIMTITSEEQHKFAPNFLNIGNGAIVAPYDEPSYLERLKQFGINVITVDVESLIHGFGGVHCMTQVVKRDRLPPVDSP